MKFPANLSSNVLWAFSTSVDHCLLAPDNIRITFGGSPTIATLQELCLLSIAGTWESMSAKFPYLQSHNTFFDFQGTPRPCRWNLLRITITFLRSCTLKVICWLLRNSFRMIYSGRVSTRQLMALGLQQLRLESGCKFLWKSTCKNGWRN